MNAQAGGMPLTVDGKIVGASASAARRIRQLPAAAACK